MIRDDLLPSSVRDQLPGWTVAPGGKPGTVALTGGLFFSDGDGVTVLLRVSGQEVLASDAGVAAMRLLDAGVDLGGGRAAKAWAEILDGYHLKEIHGRITGRRSIRCAGALVADVAGAALTTDSLRWLAQGGRESTLERSLYAFLSSAHLEYQKRPSVRLPRGGEVRPTARVNAPKREVLVQAASSKQAAEHALVLVQQLARARYSRDQRFVLLDGNVDQWSPDQLDLLADNASVGFASDMRMVDAFLKEGKNPPRLWVQTTD
ncbi:hypothetical protein [Streptomyces fulvoviolaceus]|uniref:hypothetical protein n=1 Tax=Streptomyces fulvoviolaceus TaxID=285535 RepID=UPI0004C852AF|nr:hypothetical protein [Streptomyces fulvoviolaceus]